MTDMDIRTEIYEKQIEGLEEDMSPFGFISTEDEISNFWDGENRWYADEKEKGNNFF